MSLQSAVDLLGVSVSSVCNVIQAEHLQRSTMTRNTLEDGGTTIGGESLSADQIESNDMTPSMSFFLNQIITGEISVILKIADGLSILETSSTQGTVSTPGRMIPNPPAPPTVLSINHLRIMYTAVELIWMCGVEPYMRTILNEKFNWGQVLHPKSLLIAKDLMTLLLLKNTVTNDTNQILQYLQCIHNVISNSLFSTTMLPRNLRRLLIALIALSTSNGKISINQMNESNTSENTDSNLDSYTIQPQSDISTIATEMLEKICFQTENKSFVVSELRIAAQGPHWMKTAAGGLFLRLILSERGVECVLRAYLDGTYCYQTVLTYKPALQISGFIFGKNIVCLFLSFFIVIYSLHLFCLQA